MKYSVHVFQQCSILVHDFLHHIYHLFATHIYIYNHMYIYILCICIIYLLMCIIAAKALRASEGPTLNHSVSRRVYLLLLMVQKSGKLTSWGWLFIPFFYWVLYIPGASTDFFQQYDDVSCCFKLASSYSAIPAVMFINIIFTSNYRHWFRRWSFWQGWHQHGFSWTDKAKTWKTGLSSQLKFLPLHTPEN